MERKTGERRQRPMVFLAEDLNRSCLLKASLAYGLRSLPLTLLWSPVWHFVKVKYVLKYDLLNRAYINKISLLILSLSSLLCSPILIPGFYSFNWREFQESVAFQGAYEALSPGCYYACFSGGATLSTPLTPPPLPSPQAWNNKHNFSVAPWHTYSPALPGPGGLRTWPPKVTVICRFLAMQRWGFSWTEKLSASSCCYVNASRVFDYA